MGDAATFELARAQHEDIPRLADIYAWALLLDPTFGFSYAGSISHTRKSFPTRPCHTTVPATASSLDVLLIMKC